MRDYLVVEFVDDESVSVICSKWFKSSGANSKEGTVYWPPTRNVSMAAKKGMNPEDSWCHFRAKILSECDTFDKAQRRCRKAEDTSCLSTAESEAEREIRRQRCRVRYSNDDDSFETRGPVNTSQARASDSSVVRPEAPQIPPELLNSVYERTAGHASVCDNGTSLPLTSSTPAVNPMTNLHIQQISVADFEEQLLPTPVVHHVPSHHQFHQSSTGFGQQVSPIVEQQLASTPFNSRLPALPIRIQNSERFQQSTIQLLLQQNAEIKEELRQIKSTVFDVLRRQKGQELLRTGRLPAGVSLPLKTVNDVQLLEPKLLSDEFYNQMVCFLANAGGDTPFECTANIMTKLVCNDLIKDHYTWVGRSENKNSFSQLSLKRLVIDAVRKNPFTSRATEAEVCKALKKWIRGAPDREGGRAERARKAYDKRRSDLASDGRQSLRSVSSTNRSASAGRERDRSRSRSP